MKFLRTLFGYNKIKPSKENTPSWFALWFPIIIIIFFLLWIFLPKLGWIILPYVSIIVGIIILWLLIISLRRGEIVLGSRAYGITSKIESMGGIFGIITYLILGVVCIVGGIYMLLQ